MRLSSLSLKNYIQYSYMDFKMRQEFFICKVVNGKQIYELRLKVGEYLIFGPHCSTFFRAYQKSWAKVFSKIFSKAKTLLKLLYNLSDVMVFLRENREGNFYVVVSLNDWFAFLFYTSSILGIQPHAMMLIRPSWDCFSGGSWGIPWRHKMLTSRPNV